MLCPDCYEKKARLLWEILELYSELEARLEALEEMERAEHERARDPTQLAFLGRVGLSPENDGSGTDDGRLH